MKDYSQPEFYRFNEDSLLLVHFIKSRITKASRILDLGAGSGIIGIELARLLNPHFLLLIEAQADWENFLQTNVSYFIPTTTEAEVLISSFGEWSPSRTFDLIVVNPPYFLPGHGQPYKDKRKEIARSFVIDDWKILIDKIEKALAPQGNAFIVVRDDVRILSRIQTKLNKELTRSSGLVFVRLF